MNLVNSQTWGKGLAFPSTAFSIGVFADVKRNSALDKATFGPGQAPVSGTWYETHRIDI